MLNQNVLVLNKFWQGIHVINVRRAISLVYIGRAMIVSEDNNTYDFDSWRDLTDASTGECIKTVSFKIKMPKVILLLFYDRMPQMEVKFTRRNILLRDKNKCQYCSKKLDPKFLNIDHVIPRSLGGKSTWTNVVCSCINCNTKKGNRLPEDAGMKLIQQPFKPRWVPHLHFNKKMFKDNNWERFFSAAYWNVELNE